MKRFALVAVALLLGLGQSGLMSKVAAHEKGPPAIISQAQPSASEMAVVAASRILFLHHSVGADIISGMRSLDAGSGGQDHLRVVPLERIDATGGAALIEFSGGENGRPDSKIDAFVTAVRSLPPKGVDLALMKLCFVDFNPRTDVAALFRTYRVAIEDLQRDRPDIKIGHATVPLTVYPREMKWRAFRLIGKEVWEDESNAKRQEYNALLKEKFAGSPILDIAGREAQRQDGREELFVLRGRKYPALDPQKSDDGGHLNALGQRVLGAAMMRYIADAVGPSRH